ncbi:hypothetical protein [Streptomyces anandii]|uniref:hypothetical protein n=1 Tax=Streptomyces anandii TaxID=285454 RepID=UPI0036901C33
MRERSDNGGVPSGGKEVSGGKDVSGRRIDLSVPQVAGSAVAAVVAAKLASYFGVYGTIVGAGVVSAVAACGGPVFQHLFRRTGEQLRGAATAAGPVPATVPARRAPASPLSNGEFTPGTVHRARARGWRRPVLAAALVFGVTMAGITAYEAAAGSRFAGGHGTTVGAAVTGHHASSSSGGDRSPAPSPSLPSATGDGSRPSGTGTGSGGTGSSGTGSSGDTPASQAPTTGATGTAGAGTGKSGTTGSGSGGSAGDPQPGGAGARSPEPGASATTPAPSASSRSGTAAGDPAGPAAP